MGYKPSDDDIMRAAMGDLDDGTNYPPRPPRPPRRVIPQRPPQTDPPNPPRPPRPPQPELGDPPRPLRPPQPELGDPPRLPQPESGVITKSKTKPVIIALIAILATVGIVALAFLLKGSSGVSFGNRVNVSEFRVEEVTLTGYNGSGRASFEQLFDYDGMYRAVIEGSDTYFDIDSLYEYIDVKAESINNLSNGDKIKVTVTTDYEALNAIGLKKTIVGDEVCTYECTVSGLQECATVDPFKVVKSMIFDETSDKCYFEIDTSYNEEIDGVKLAYSGESHTYSDTVEVKVTNQSGEDLFTYSLSYNFDTFVSTGKVKVYVKNPGYSEDGQEQAPDEKMYQDNGVVFSSVNKEYDAIKCNFVKKADEISEEDYKAFEEAATEDVRNTYPLAKLERVYWGYDGNGDGGNFIGGTSGGHFNHIRFAYSYNVNGYNNIACVNYYDLKITEDGKICNFEECLKNSGGGDAIESLEEIEENVPDLWTEFYKVK